MAPGTVRKPLSEPYSKGHPTVSPHHAASSILQALDKLDEAGSFTAYNRKRIEW